MNFLWSLRARARALTAETLALYRAARHPATPWYAKLLVAAIVAYALSPIDLIPDFIPVLGLLDDVILLPLGIALALRMIPAEVMAECRAAAARALDAETPTSRSAAVAIVSIWIAFFAAAIVWGYRSFWS